MTQPNVTGQEVTSNTGTQKGKATTTTDQMQCIRNAHTANTSMPV